MEIMGGPCSNIFRKKNILIRIVELSKANNETVSQEIIKLISEVHQGNIDFSKLCLILYNAAPCAMKAENT